MSGLYAGITFSKSGSESASPAPAAASAAAKAGASTSKTAEQAEVDRQRQAALEDAARYAAQQAELQAKEQAESARKAALGFQPVLRKRPQPGKARPAAPVGAVISAGPSTIAASSSSSATIAAPPSLINEMNGGASSMPVISAPPMDLQDVNTATSKTTGRPFAPPSMTLDDGEDVNGFRSTKAGKKANSKKKKRNAGTSNRKDDDPSLAWTAEYDPARPTDYAEYKAYSKRARSERRAAILREKVMAKRKQGMQSEGSDYSEDAYSDEDGDSDEERRQRIAKANSRFFAPPTSYEGTDSPSGVSFGPEEPDLPMSTKANQEQDSMKVDSVNKPDASPPADDGWSNWSAVPAKIDDPFQRRLALSQQRPISPAQPPMRTEPVDHNPSPQPYQASSIAPSTFVQGPSFVASALAPSAPSQFQPTQAQAFPLPPHMMPSLPTSASQTPQAFHSPSTTPSAEASVAETPAPKVPVAIEEAQARARAIAARLASLGKIGSGAKASPSTNEAKQPASSMSPLSMPPVPDANEPIPGLGGPSSAPQQQVQPSKDNAKPEDFAKNLMAKYGWTKGQGLGATSQGMVNPLSLAGSDGSKTKSKKEQQQFQAQGQPKGGPVGIASAKGRIVSDLKTEKEQMERQKYGEPTRVVCLTNIVGRNEVDEELVADVSEEARKLGVLEKCFVHLQPPYVSEDEAVRVFIVFSGLVGAWKAVKAFDGRYFGGRNVKAKFYNEQALDLGVLHL